MISESYYPQDTRVHQEAELLKKKHHNVVVIALRNKDQKRKETINGVKVYRIPQIELFKSEKQLSISISSRLRKTIIICKAAIGYSIEYLYFTLLSAVYSFYILIKHNFDVIHTHNPPDTLFLIALFYKIILRKKFVYDHHDLSPDLFLQKFKNKGRMFYKILLLLEKLSCKYADVIIATNESYKKIEIERSLVNPEKIFIVRNGPDTNVMKQMEPIAELRNENKTILCYIGSINFQDGLQYLLDVIENLVNVQKQKNVLLLIIGDGDYLGAIKEQALHLGITDFIIFIGYINDRKQICRYLSSADIFVDAAIKSFLNDNSTFIKHMEYMIFGRPIVSFDLKESQYSVKDAGIFVPSNDTQAMAKAIIDLMNNAKYRQKLGENAVKRVQELTWQKVSTPLLTAYEYLNKKN